MSLTMIVFIFGIVCSILEQIAAETGSAYHGPPPVKERFTYHDHNYFLYSERVSWDEALAICKSSDGGLAVADDSSKAAFLSQSISEAWAPFEDMWIGGQKIQNAWQWVGFSDKLISDTTHQDPNSSFVYPPWIDGESPDRANHDCLAIDRNGHSDPFFVDVECRLPRPFICEQAQETKKEENPLVRKRVDIYEVEYILYHGRLTWEGAVAYCRQNGYSLATVKNMTVALRLAVAMLKTRPEFEDAWIGGQFKNNKWSWVADSEDLVESKDFPPWAHPPVKGKDCILFDRHLCEAPKFLSVKCNRVRDFICMKVNEEETTEDSVSAPTRFRRWSYNIHVALTSWDEARFVCEELDHARMLELKDMDEALFIMQLMADNRQEIDHIWLGGRLFTDDWKWIYSNTFIPEKAGEDGFPPWCETEKMSEMPCLNMDRQNHLTPLLYGLECNTTQAVICMKDAPPKGMTVILPDKTAYTTSMYEKTGANISWQSANSACMIDVGMLIHDVDLADLTKIIKELGEGSYYIGAKVKRDGTAEWVRDAATLVDPVPFNLGSLPEYQKDKECLAIRTKGESPNTRLDAIISVSCNEVYSNYGYIAREACKKHFDEQGEDKTKWKCSWEEGMGVDEKTLGKQCWRHCPRNEVLRGSNRMICTSNDWIGTHGVKQLPICIDAASSLDFIETEMDKTTGAVFIIDNSDRIIEDDYRVFKYFIATTIAKFTPTAARKLAFHIIIINESTTKQINIAETDHPCKVITTIDEKMKTDDNIPSGRRDFKRALHAAKIFAENRDNITVFFLAGGPNQGDSFKEAARYLRKKSKAVITIGVTHYDDGDLREIASPSSDDGAKTLNMLGFTNSEILKEAIDAYSVGTRCEKALVPIKSNAAVRGKYGGWAAYAPAPTEGKKQPTKVEVSSNQPSAVKKLEQKWNNISPLSRSREAESSSSLGDKGVKSDSPPDANSPQDSDSLPESNKEENRSLPEVVGIESDSPPKDRSLAEATGIKSDSPPGDEANSRSLPETVGIKSDSPPGDEEANSRSLPETLGIKSDSPPGDEASSRSLPETVGIKSDSPPGVEEANSRSLPVDNKSSTNPEDLEVKSITN